MLAAAYAMLIWLTARAPLAEAIAAGVATAIAAALVGTIVRTVGARSFRAPLQLPAKLLVHALLALLFAGLWSAAIVGLTSLASPRQTSWFIANALGWQMLLGVLLYGTVAAIAELTRTTHELHEREAVALRAELHALRARLNPHFLFNTLNSIVSLVRTDPEAVETALERFASLLRYVLHASESAEDDVPLERELQFVRTYLQLERLRFGGRLTVLEDVDEDALDERLPALTLQPLVENAIQHGIAPSLHGGTIRIMARTRADSLNIVVTDDGAGAADVVRQGSGLGLGLDLVRRRLSTRYGARAALDLEHDVGAGFTVRLTLPLSRSSLSIAST
jgi:sensor histidine kinase YesM